VPSVEVTHFPWAITDKEIEDPTQTQQEIGVSGDGRWFFAFANRVEYFILVDVASVFVMVMVTQFPRVVRDQDKTVKNAPYNTVQPVVPGERTVPTIVTEHK